MRIKCRCDVGCIVDKKLNPWWYRESCGDWTIAWSGSTCTYSR